MGVTFTTPRTLPRAGFESCCSDPACYRCAGWGEARPEVNVANVRAARWLHVLGIRGVPFYGGDIVPSNAHVRVLLRIANSPLALAAAAAVLEQDTEAVRVQARALLGVFVAARRFDLCVVWR